MPPGWYPDQTNPYQIRYWDGARWTEHIAPASPAQPPRPAYPYAAYSPRPVAARPPTAGHTPGAKIGMAVGGGIALLFVLGMCAAVVTSDDEPSGDSATTATPSSAPETRSESTGSPQASSTPTEPAEPVAPTDQTRFLEAVSRGQERAEGANELQVVEARRARAKAMCRILPRSLEVENWLGTVDEISTVLGGDAGVLVISVADGVTIGTWNNELSDFQDNTVVAVDSPLWKQMLRLTGGDQVRFTGRFISSDNGCIRESSLLDENGMLTPSFIMRFDSVRPEG